MTPKRSPRQAKTREAKRREAKRREAKRRKTKTREADPDPPRAGEPIRRARASGRAVSIAIAPRKGRGRLATLSLPDAVAALVADALDAVAAGQRVSLAIEQAPDSEASSGANAEPNPYLIPYLILDRPPDDELTTQEAARALRVSRPTIIKAIDEGRLRARKVGKHRRIRVYDFNAFARGHQCERIRDAVNSDRFEQDLGLYAIPLPHDRSDVMPEGREASPSRNRARERASERVRERGSKRRLAATSQARRGAESERGS